MIKMVTFLSFDLLFVELLHVLSIQNCIMPVEVEISNDNFRDRERGERERRTEGRRDYYALEPEFFYILVFIRNLKNVTNCLAFIEKKQCLVLLIRILYIKIFQSCHTWITGASQSQFFKNVNFWNTNLSPHT